MGETFGKYRTDRDPNRRCQPGIIAYVECARICKPSTSPFLLSAKQGRFLVPFLPVFGVTRPGSEPTQSFLAAIYTVGVFNQQEFEVMVKLIT